MKDLIHDEKKALKYLGRVRKNPKLAIHAVCAEHYFLFVGQYKEMKPTCDRKCCDPFKRHFKDVKASLRTVQMVMLLKAKSKDISLVYGNKICSNCVAKLFDVPAQDEDTASDQDTPPVQAQNVGVSSGDTPTQGTQESASSSSSVLSPSIVKNRAIKSLTDFGLSSLNPRKRDHQGRLKFGKEKLVEASELSQKRLCLALDLAPGSLKSSVPQRAADMELLLQDIKTEIPNSDRCKVYQLLSLVPLSIKTYQACKMFNVSKTRFKKARELRVQQKTILPQVKFTRKSSVSDETKKLILDFYCDDENSKLMPGKDDKVSMSKGVYEQKRLMLCNVEELFALFKKKYPDLKVGLSFFLS